jgi:hypothetical protein
VVVDSTIAGPSPDPAPRPRAHGTRVGDRPRELFELVLASTFEAGRGDAMIGVPD